MLEDLTGSQLIYIANLTFTAVLVISFSWIFTKIINYLTSRHIHFKIEKKVAEELKQDLNKQSIVDKIKNWRENKKKSKEEYPYI